MTCIEMPIAKALINRGWKHKLGSWSLEKNEWRLIFDTGSWIEVGSSTNPRIFDVPVPQAEFEDWTVNLIEHLCRSDDIIQSK